MEKSAQTPSGAPRRRRRRRGSGSGAAQPQPAAVKENSGREAAGKEGGKPNQPKPQRQPAPRKAGGKEGKEAKEAPTGRSRHRGQTASESPAQTQNSGRRGRGEGQASAARESHSAKQGQRNGRAARHAVEENPGLELISRRPPKQKFANFEEYLAAHGGMTVPLPDEPEAEMAPAEVTP